MFERVHKNNQGNQIGMNVDVVQTFKKFSSTVSVTRQNDFCPVGKPIFVEYTTKSKLALQEGSSSCTL